MFLFEQIAWAIGGVGTAFIFSMGAYAYIHSYIHWMLMPAIFLFAILFFVRLPRKYYVPAVLIYTIFSLPVTAMSAWMFYSVYR